jgi:DNA-binding LacI/PurR family transcriptional regulator
MLRLQKRPATLKDIAEKAGVSIMAVSTVLNSSKSTVGVSVSTRERILEIAQELEYRPNAFARSLRMKRIGTIGLVHDEGLLRTDDPFIRELFNGINDVLASNDLDLLIYCGIDVHDRSTILSRLLGNKIDGLLILPTEGGATWINKLADTHVPIVVVSETVQGLPSVTADDTGGAKLIAEYLFGQGHRHVLYRRSSTLSSTDEARYQAFQLVAQQSGHKITATRANDILDSVTAEEERLVLNRSGDNPVTAVACWRDQSAERMMNYCLHQRIAVPGELAITGFDGAGKHIHLSGRVITTVKANWQEVGQEAARLIVSLTKHQSGNAKGKLVKARMLIGDTT